MMNKLIFKYITDKLFMPNFVRAYTSLECIFILHQIL
jgi:hypothetical protein